LAHGSKVEAGVKISESPRVVQVPVTAGSNVGRGEKVAGRPESLTRTGKVPSAIVLWGRAVRRVAGSIPRESEALVKWDSNLPSPTPTPIAISTAAITATKAKRSVSLIALIVSSSSVERWTAQF